jgi:hypothetical protein
MKYLYENDFQVWIDPKIQNFKNVNLNH